MGKHGTTARARVADIVAAAGVSNDTFYRHFASKDALGGRPPRGRHRTARQLRRAPDEQGIRPRSARCAAGSTGCCRRRARRSPPRRWPCSGTGAASAPACTAGRHNASVPARRPAPRALRRARAAPTRELDASLVAHATLGKMADYLWARAAARPRAETRAHRSSSASRSPGRAPRRDGLTVSAERAVGNGAPVVLVETLDEVTVVTLNRPEARNALNRRDVRAVGRGRRGDDPGSTR